LLLHDANDVVAGTSASISRALTTTRHGVAAVVATELSTADAQVGHDESVDREQLALAVVPRHLDFEPARRGR